MMTHASPFPRPSAPIRLLATAPYLLAILVVLYAVRYGFPQTDDFCTLGRLVHQHDANPLLETWHLYQHWTGRYSSSFLVAFVGWLSTVLPFPLHAVYATALALLLGVFAFSTWRTSAWASAEAQGSIVLAALLTAVPLVLMPSKLESLYWLTGNAVYFAGIASLLLTATSTLSDEYVDGAGNSVPTYSWATLAGIVLTVGFNEFLAIALGGFLVLRAIMAAPARSHLKQHVAYLAVFALAFAASVLAPGNFARDAGLATQRHDVGHALELTLRSWNVFLQMHVTPNKGLIAAVLLTALAAGWILGERLATARIRRFFPLPLALVGSFPLHFFVYSFLSGEETPGRIVNQAYPLALVGGLLVLAWGSARLRRRSTRTLPALLPWIILFCCGLVLIGSAQFRSVAVESHQFGPIWEAEQKARERALILAARRSEAASVTPFTPQRAPTPMFQGADISADPTNWVNQCVASYYGVPTVVVARAAAPTP